MCVLVREDQGFGFARTASPVRSGKKKHTVPAMTTATITATTIFTAGSTESGRPQLGQVRALGLTSWSQSGQGLVMATFNYKAPCAVKRAGFVDDMLTGSSAVRQSKTVRARFCEAVGYSEDASACFPRPM
jgi:hypothetical protein